MSNKIQETTLKILKRRRKPIDFVTLWDLVATQLEFSEADRQKKVGRFYNSLVNDRNLVQLEKNHWDLRDRQGYAAVKMDMSKFDDDDLDSDMMEDGFDGSDMIDDDDANDLY